MRKRLRHLWPWPTYKQHKRPIIWRLQQLHVAVRHSNCLLSKWTHSHSTACGWRWWSIYTYRQWRNYARSALRQTFPRCPNNYNCLLSPPPSPGNPRNRDDSSQNIGCSAAKVSRWPCGKFIPSLPLTSFSLPRLPLPSLIPLSPFPSPSLPFLTPVLSPLPSP